MPAKHSLRIDLDANGKLAVTHRCAVEVAGQEIAHSEPIELSDSAVLTSWLADLIKTNGTEMESRATALAVQHAAAVAGTLKKGTKSLKLGGTVGALGNPETKKV